jgi:RHS repeat-associated protein
MRKYYYAGAARVALRAGAGTGASGLNWLVSDHLGSTAITADSSGNKVAELRYKAWGETRYAWGSTPTGRQYTGQINEPSFGLYFYGARWYDASLGRFISPDPIVPGTGDGGNPNAVGYLGGTTYSSLTVDYHENRFLNQLNSENRFKSQDPYWRLQPVPTISTTFDRYAYSLNNPVRYVDPSGHFVILAALALITPVGWVAMGVTAVGVVLYFAVPGVREAVTNGIYEAREAASNGLNALFAKGEYIPPGLSSAERNAYREAVHAYKRAWGLGPKDNVPKKILDDIADAIKEGLKPGDAADVVDGPPEADSGD